MIPDITIGNIVLSWYIIILVFTLTICIIYFFKRLKTVDSLLNISKSKQVFFPVIIIIIGAIGTRLLSVAEHLITSSESHSFFEIKLLLLVNGGLSFWGAPIIILLLLPFLLKIYPVIQWITIMDIIAPVWCLGYALARFGCLLSGDGCYGVWTNLPWGMHFPYGSPPNILPVHPTPIYESLIHLTILFFLSKIDRNKIFIGQTFFIFLFFTSLSRFWIEFIRINPKILLGLSLAQLISLALILFSCIIYFYLKRRSLSANSVIHV